MRRAFTLIELLVSMGVMLSVLSIMAFGLRDAYRRQNLYGSAERVRQAFLRAKTNVQSGRKDCQLCGANPATTPPYACGSGDVSLSGWLVELGANEIITEGICGGSVFESRTERLPAGILLYYSPVNAVLFKPLGSGTDLESGLAVAIGGSGLDIYRGFTVTSDGEVSDLADVTPVPTPTAGSATPTPTRTPTPTPGGATSTPTRTPTPTVVSNMVASQITVSSDDAEQTESSGVVDLGSSDLEFDQDGAAPQMIGLRFNNMTVPLNATITGAYVEFTVDELWGVPTSVSFFGEVSDNPTTFTTAAYNISSRPRTTARVDWNNIPAWDSTTGTAIGDKKQSPDISPIIQELVNRPGWVSGNSMVLIIDGPNAGGRRTTDVSGVTGPRLVVTYALEVPATPTPTITPTPTPYCTIGAVTTPSPLNLVVGGAAGSLQSNVTVVGSATVNQVNFNPSPVPAGAFGVSAALDTTLPYQTNVTAFASGNGNIQQVAQLSSGGNCAVLTPVTVTVPTATPTLIPTPTACVAPATPSGQSPVGTTACGLTSVTLSWNPVAGAEYYPLRVDDLSNPWTGTCATVNPGDVCDSYGVTGTSYNLSVVPGRSYQWWVHAGNSCGWSGYTQVTFDVPVCPTPTPTVASNMVASQITVSSDDAEQTESSGVVDLGSSDLEFDQDGAAPQMIGLRFNNMTVPLNATITGAYVEFTVDELWGVPTSVSFFGEVSDNPTTFTTAAYNISSRPRTTARVDWNNIPAWDSTTGTAIGDKKQSPDISPIIQELVNRPGWVSGNSMVLIIDGPNAGGRRTTDVSGVTGPRLVVTYALEVPATPTPTITPTPTPYCTIGAVTTPSPLNLVVGGAAGSLQSNVTVVGSATVNQVNFNPSPVPAGAFGVSAALDTTLPYQTNVTAFASGNGNIQQVAQLSSGGNCAVLTPVTVTVPTATPTLIPTPTACVAPATPSGQSPVGTTACGLTSVTLSWNPVAGAEYYPLRVDDLSNPWTGTCATVNPGDVCDSYGVTGTSYNLSVVPGRSYQWWVHAGNSCGWSGYTQVTFDVPVCPTPTVTPTTVPATPTPTTGATRIKDATFEGGSSTGTYGLETDTYNNTVISTNSPIKNSWSVYIPEGYVNSNLTQTFTADELFVSFYLYLPSQIPATGDFVAIYNGATRVGVIQIVRSGTSQKLKLLNNTTAVGSNSTSLASLTVYRVGLHQKRGTGSNGVLEAYFATGDAAFTTPFALSATQTFTTGATKFVIGSMGVVMSVQIDNVRIDSGSMPPSGDLPRPLLLATLWRWIEL